MKPKVVVSDTDSTESKISWNFKIDSSCDQYLSQPICKDLHQN